MMAAVMDYRAACLRHVAKNFGCVLGGYVEKWVEGRIFPSEMLFSRKCVVENFSFVLSRTDIATSKLGSPARHRSLAAKLATNYGLAPTVLAILRTTRFTNGVG